MQPVNAETASDLLNYQPTWLGILGAFMVDFGPFVLVLMLLWWCCYSRRTIVHPTATRRVRRDD